MERIYFKTNLEYRPTRAKKVFEADNASGYFKSGELHLVGEYHYVYKYDGQVGWYMQNPKDGVDRFLCEGACPTLPVENLSVLDEEAYAAIVQVDEPTEENIEEE